LQQPFLKNQNFSFNLEIPEFYAIQNFSFNLEIPEFYAIYYSKPPRVGLYQRCQDTEL
jgi:hypothetical protein